MTLDPLIQTLPWLTNLAARYTHNTAEAEDCAIIALERIEPRLQDFQTDAEARAFLVKTARNAAIDASKTNAHREEREAIALELANYSDEQVENVLRLQMVIKYGIPQLVERRQEIALLWAHGADTPAIAGKLGLTEKTVRNQKGLIIRDLKRWVKKGKLQ